MKKNIIKEFIKISIDSWSDELNNSFTRNLFKSIAHWNIFLLIAENTFFSKNYSFEKLCRLINPSVASRATIQRILSELIDLKFIEKKINVSDSRVKYFYLTDEGINLFSQYVENEMKTFKSLRDVL